jgi:hypothetical protein
MSEDNPTPIADNAPPVNVVRVSKLALMKAYFAESDRETVHIRKEDGDQTVRVNGYGFRIQAGQRVKVPVDVAEILRNASLA